MHPGGNDSTAVLGDFNRPFATIEGAFYGANGLDMTTTNIINGVIEVWPGTTDMYEETTMQGAGQTIWTLFPDRFASHVISRPLIAATSWKLHLKPGVHIRYAYDYVEYGENGLGNALFQFNETIAPGEDISLSLQVTSEDNTNVINNVNSNYVQPQHSSLIAWVNNGHKMSFDNVTILDNPAFLSEDGLSVAIFSFFVDRFAKLTLRNTHVRTNNRYARAFNQNSGAVQVSMANVVQGYGGQLGQESVVEVINSNITLYCLSEAEDENFPAISQFYLDLKGGQDERADYSMGELRLRNSNFVNATNYFTDLMPMDVSFVYVSGSFSTIYVDDCVIFRGYNLALAESTYPLPAYFGLADGVFKSAALTNNGVYFVARSITNYTINLYTGGTWTERSGAGRSLVPLGVAGFGLCEKYELIRPYDWIEFP